MSKIILVTGGARSGKSSYGENLLKKLDGKKGYIATAVAFDEGMKERIKKHKAMRPDKWKTFELQYNISSHIDKISKECDSLILDCITVFISNIFYKENIDWDKITNKEINSLENKIDKEIELIISKIKEYNLNLIIITNEIGSGIVPANKHTRVYRDIVGRINQKVARLSNKAFACISGIPVKLK
ncbi:MAG: bifunctional adenosylcobinamide kinase/adenosylcobinamide-phosphate guanylyltransferase [Bacillota bacterium]